MKWKFQSYPSSGSWREKANLPLPSIANPARPPSPPHYRNRSQSPLGRRPPGRSHIAWLRPKCCPPASVLNSQIFCSLFSSSSMDCACASVYDMSWDRGFRRLLYIYIHLISFHIHVRGCLTLKIHRCTIPTHAVPRVSDLKHVSWTLSQACLFFTSVLTSTLKGSFSALLKPIFAPKCYCYLILQDYFFRLYKSWILFVPL